MNSVLKGSAYVLVHAPDMVIHSGTTQTAERAASPDSEYLKALPAALRDYSAAMAYYPNQVYLGNRAPEELAGLWDDRAALHDLNAARSGPFGEIMPQEEFYLLLQMCDVFGVVRLDEGFVAAHRAAVLAHPLYDDALKARLTGGVPLHEIESAVSEEHAEGLYHGGALVGCVCRAHDFDVNLSAHVMLENLASKASCVLSILHAVHSTGVDKAAVDYVIDCCEEACGDMNQRGGGNLAKAAAEIAGLTGATGSDVRAFCAAPAHAVITAAALVAAGAYETVLVAAGGCTAKLGMNAKDHVKKGLPVLEDVLAGFAVVITRDNGIDPVIDLSLLGRHTVGTGSAPQAVISSLVSAPLARQGLGILDIDKYAAELQNPDVTKPAGAGNVPEANYKMIGALAARNGEMTPKDLPAFIQNHGMPGWAPTQGHIPSGVPYLGFARQAMLRGQLNTAMILGKGSLFLGRMTNLFDGVSFVLRRNPAAKDALPDDKAAPLAMDHSGDRPCIVLTAPGSERPESELLEGAVAAARDGVHVIYLGTLTHPELTCIHTATEAEARAQMERLLESGQAAGAVTMHYPFPIGTATVGRSIANGRALYLATTTGTPSTDRVEGMVRGAIYGIAAAKASGVARPTVGILNLDGARSAEAALKALARGGYPISFARSQRADGGCIMRGNDVLAGSCDVLVTDPLTGNVLSKMLAAATTGGLVEDTGDGYGPAIGEDYDKLILILSRGSGANVVRGALSYAASLSVGRLAQVAAAELAAAGQAGLGTALSGKKAAPTQAEEIAPPPAEVVTAEIHGVEILELDDAARALWKAGLYAETGMGCTGPVILVSTGKEQKARDLLRDAGYLA